MFICMKKYSTWGTSLKQHLALLHTLASHAVISVHHSGGASSIWYPFCLAVPAHCDDVRSVHNTMC